MKYFIASDLHGSAYYCRAMLERFEAEKADKLIFLGDILYHGPRNDLPRDYAPKAVIEMLDGYSKRILAVRGNCDTEVDQMVLSFPCLAEYALLSASDRMIFITHGHKFNAKTPPPLTAGDILLHGHTHVPACERFGNENIYLNPGSVSIPKEGSQHSYMILDGATLEWKDIESGRAYKTFNI